MKVHFDKKAMKGTIFRGNKSLKLVTYCDSNSKYEQYIAKEFLAYRIYNLLTDYSFRVRPMQVSYVDSERGGKPIIRFGFFIEDIDDVKFDELINKSHTFATWEKHGDREVMIIARMLQEPLI